MRTQNYFITGLLLLATTFVFASNNKPATSENYKVNTELSKVIWTGTKPGGEHYGFVKLSESSFEVTDGKLTGGQFTIDLNSIVCEDLSNEMYNKKLVDHLKSEDFFNVEKFATGTFKITEVNHLSDNQYKITGDLTLKGITKSISFNAELEIDGKTIKGSTEKFTIDRTQWDIKHMSKSLSADLKDKYIDDEIGIKIVVGGVLE